MDSNQSEELHTFYLFEWNLEIYELIRSDRRKLVDSCSMKYIDLFSYTCRYLRLDSVSSNISFDFHWNDLI